MKNYAIDIFRIGRRREPSLRLEFPRERFTSREFKNYLIASLLDLGAEGKYCKHLDAVVTCEGKRFLTIRCDTEDGAARLTMARPREVFRHLRTVAIVR